MDGAFFVSYLDGVPDVEAECFQPLHTVPCYQKAPSLAYKIGECTLEKDGTLRIPDSLDRETVSSLLGHLKEKGFTGKTEQTEDRQFRFPAWEIKTAYFRRCPAA